MGFSRQEYWSGLTCPPRGEHIYTTICKTDNQQGPTIYRELCSIFCNNLQGKRIWKRMCIYIYIYVCVCVCVCVCMGFPGGLDGKESTLNVRDLGLIPGSGRFPRGGHSNPLQCSCLENPMDRGAWRATVYGVAESDMTEWLRTTHICIYMCVCVYIYTHIPETYTTLYINYSSIFKNVKKQDKKQKRKKQLKGLSRNKKVLICSSYRFLANFKLPVWYWCDIANFLKSY